jgi:hypothetical protein
LHFRLPDTARSATSVWRELHRLLSHSGGLRSRVAAKAQPGRSGRPIPAIVTLFEPNRRVLRLASPRVHLIAVLAGRETTAISRCSLRSLSGELSARAPGALCLSAL